MWEQVILWLQILRKVNVLVVEGETTKTKLIKYGWGGNVLVVEGGDNYWFNIVGGGNILNTKGKATLTNLIYY
jgi:hypothetical protein